MNIQAWKMKFLNFMTIPVSHDSCELMGLRKVVDITIKNAHHGLCP